MTRHLLTLALLATTAATISAQEGPVSTQAIITVDSKTPAALTAKDLTLKVDGRAEPLTSLAPVPPTGAQVAILIDDGLRVSAGRELATLRTFVQSLRPGTEIFIGYMQNGRVIPTQPFTTDYAAAAQNLRMPLGSAGISASPYFCLSDFVKKWHPASREAEPDLQSNTRPAYKARFVLMITNGVDPYNGSTSITNQSSPYVDSAIKDAQRAGVPVYSIYYANAGFGARRGSFSGQSYLAQLAEATGGTAYFEGLGSPVSMDPFLKKFASAIAESYVATFSAPGNKDFVRLQVKTTLPGTSRRAPAQVRPGTNLSAPTE